MPNQSREEAYNRPLAGLPQLLYMDYTSVSLMLNKNHSHSSYKGHGQVGLPEICNHINSQGVKIKKCSPKKGYPTTRSCKHIPCLRLTHQGTNMLKPDLLVAYTNVQEKNHYSKASGSIIKHKHIPFDQQIFPSIP